MKTNHHNHQPTLQNKSILIMLAAVILLACSQSALAQATPNKIPKWTDNSGVLGPSTIFEDTSGNLGIGTTNPTVNLELSGTANPIVRINGAALGAAFLFNSQTGTGQDRATLSVNAFYNGSWHFVNTSTPSWLLQMRNNEDDFVINRAVPNSYAFNALLTVAGTGNVGIGTTPSSYKLDVNGNTNVTGNINVFGPPNSGLGNITVSGNINAKFQDVAEWVQSAEKLPTGTVVALDSTKSNQVVASTVSYDTRVAGVISEQPGIALGEKGESKVLVATSTLFEARSPRAMPGCSEITPATRVS